MYPYDKAKAKQVLEADGWKMNAETKIYEKDGKPLTLRQVTTSGGPTQKAAEFVQASLKEIGFDYQVEAMLYDATVKRMADNDYEVSRLWFALSDPHDAFFMALHSGQITAGGRFNRSRVEDPKLDGLIQKGIDEEDNAKRTEIYNELHKYVMEQAYILPVYDGTLRHVMTSKLQGFKTDLLGRPYLVDSWMMK